MRIDVVNRHTTEKLDMNILEIENFRPEVIPSIGTTWQVILNEDYRVPEIFDDKYDAIREMNGIKRDYLRVQSEEETKAQAVESAGSTEYDEDDEEPLFTDLTSELLEEDEDFRQSDF